MLFSLTISTLIETINTRVEETNRHTRNTRLFLQVNPSNHPALFCDYRFVPFIDIYDENFQTSYFLFCAGGL